jgi:single-stranded DNA-binding protein
MQNKVIIEGIICNELTLNKFGGTFIKLNNKRSYEYQGKNVESQCFVDIEIKPRIAQQVVNGFKKGDYVHIEGFLKPKEVMDITDANGYKIYKENIVAQSVDALGAGTDSNRHSSGHAVTLVKADHTEALTTQGKPVQKIETQTRINGEQRKQPYKVVNEIRNESSSTSQNKATIEQPPLDFSDDYEELPF